MILADTSVWIDHLRSGDATLAQLLERASILMHPWVTGELTLGRLQRRDELLELLRGLPQATTATDDEILVLVGRNDLHGTGIGYVDAQLLAATKLTDGATLWTRDRRLAEQAARLGCAFVPSGAPGTPGG